MTYSTVNAFVRHLVEKFEVNLEDFSKFNNNVIAVIGSLKNGYSDCSSYCYKDYVKFTDGDGGNYFDADNSRKAVEFFDGEIKELEKAREEFKELLELPMSEVHEKRRINSQEKSINYTIMSGYVNSSYRYNKIPITLNEFISKLIERREDYKDGLGYYLSYSEAQLDEEFGYVKEDVQRLKEIFYDKGDLKGIDSLYREVGNLKTFNNAIVCLVHNVYYGLDGFKEYEFEQITPFLIKNTLDDMDKQLDK